MLTEDNVPLLSVENLHVSYGEAEALAGVSFHINAGEIVSIVGANGAGKTTLIRTIGGMIRSDVGRIAFGGLDITNLECHDVCEVGVAQVPEGRQIFPSLSLLENLQLGAHLRRARPVAKANLDRVFSIFPRLAERRAQSAGTLSGGEQQMLAIGRALMSNPALVMFDEPSLGLSPALTEEMFKVVTMLHQDGLSIVLVEQNVAESLRLCQRAYVLEAGKITLEGNGADLLVDDRVRQAYLGL